MNLVQTFLRIKLGIDVREWLKDVYLTSLIALQLLSLDGEAS
jgi:hypothetical protein